MPPSALHPSPWRCMGPLAHAYSLVFWEVVQVDATLIGYEGRPLH